MACLTIYLQVDYRGHLSVEVVDYLDPLGLEAVDYLAHLGVEVVDYLAHLGVLGVLGVETVGWGRSGN